LDDWSKFLLTPRWQGWCADKGTLSVDMAEVDPPSPWIDALASFDGAETLNRRNN